MVGESVLVPVRLLRVEARFYYTVGLRDPGDLTSQISLPPTVAPRKCSPRFRLCFTICAE